MKTNESDTSLQLIDTDDETIDLLDLRDEYETERIEEVEM